MNLNLAVDINSKLNFNDHCDRILTKARQRIGLTRRTCSFVNDTRRRRVLYLTLVRSLFEHCSQIWRPNGKVYIKKFEDLQKFCIKWILDEEYIRYNSYSTYILKCREVNLLPMANFFDLNDLVLFHKIVYEVIPIKFPNYLSFFSGSSRLRSCRLDSLCLVSNLQLDSHSDTYLKKSFFYRTHLKWNALPLELRQITLTSTFKQEESKFLWKYVLEDNDLFSDDEDLLDTG